jgi:hypothetical protein
MDGKIWMYVRWKSELRIGILSGSMTWWDEYFQDFDPLTIQLVEAREVIR